MATAEIIKGDTTIVLKMSEEEAGALLTVFANVGGHPEKSPRGLISKLNNALWDTRVKRVGSMSGGVYFRDEVGKGTTPSVDLF